jgi:glucose/arabinose dehydrogenase
MRTKSIGALVAIWLAVFGTGVQAALTGSSLVVNGLSSPVFATYAPGDSQHLFVVQLGGTIKVVDLQTKTVLATPFLNVPDTKAEGEGGLLGMAFDPQYNQPGTTGFGKFYTYVTVDNGGVSVPGGPGGTPQSSAFSTHIREYSVSSNPLVANAAATEIMSWPRPENNHVGGWIGFGPKDGYLYIDSGDGGNGYDQGGGHFEPGGNAQNTTDLPNAFMGKQLRIDVHGDDFPSDPNQNYAIPSTNPFVSKTGADEIWAYGLRNPYRASFDRDTGDLWIGDVGQDQREEIDKQPSSSTGGANYGWRLREGNIQTPNVGGAAPSDYVPPVYDYDHSGAEHGANYSGHAVIGGYVYRGPDPSLQGQYFFGDEVNNHIWEMNPATSAVTNIDTLLVASQISNPASFAEDAVGNLYFLNLGSGSIYKFTTNATLPGDYNRDGTVNAADYTVWRDTLGQHVTAHTGADGDGSGVIDAGDYTVWTTNFGTSVHTTPGAGSAVPEPSAALLFFQAVSACAIMEGVRRMRGASQTFLADIGLQVLH